MSKRAMLTIPTSLPDHDDDAIVFPSRVRVVKRGTITEVYCAETGRQVTGITDVKLDLSNGKSGEAKLSFKCKVVKVEIVDAQIPLPLGGER